MVQQALNRHSQIIIPPETKFFFSFLGLSKRAQQEHIVRLNSDLNIKLDVPQKRVVSDEDGRAFYESLATEYAARIDKRGASLFGEKTPEHTGHLARIRRLFPDAKVLFLYRDGRDVALSLAKAPWMPPDLEVGFMVWLYYQRIVLQAMSSNMPGFHFARYEDIVANPEQQFSEILSFLGVPDEPNVARGYGNTEGVPLREYPWKGAALQKITPERVGSFRRELSLSQIALLERLGKQTLSSSGYPLVTDGAHPLTARCLLRLSRHLVGFLGGLPGNSLIQELTNQLALLL
jgi:hypothetical protein